MSPDAECRHMLEIIDARLLAMLDPARGAAPANARQVAAYKAIRLLLQRLIDDREAAGPTPR